MRSSINEQRSDTTWPAAADPEQPVGDMPPARQVRQQLKRITGSPMFRHSLRLKSFLTFVVEAALAGHADRIKSYTIAVEALDRDPSFDPQTNPIVRVEAGRLRRTLARYYAAAASADPVMIELPRGSYVPIFRWARTMQQPPRLPVPETPAICYQPSARAAPDCMELLARQREFQARQEILQQQLTDLVSEIEAARQALNQPHIPLQGRLAPDRCPEPGPAAAGLPALNKLEIRSTAAFRLIALLDALSARLLASRDLKSAVEAILEAALRLHCADFGNVQLLDQAGAQLVIHAQRGFKKEFLEAFARVSADDGCWCGRALRAGVAVVVADVFCNPDFAAFRNIASKAGFMAVESTPLITSNGRLVGVVSTHFAHPHTPSLLDMMTMQLCARFAADIIARLDPAQSGAAPDWTHRAA